MLKLLKAELDKMHVFEGKLPPILTRIVDAIPNQTINYRMKLTIAVSEMIVFASHLRRNITHWNGSSIPINAITFSIAASGDGKDSSVDAARKCFNKGYDILEAKRKKLAKQNAIKEAVRSGVDPEEAEKWEAYRDFYIAPNPLFVSPSTSEGFIQHLNDVDKSGIGAGYTQSGEFGAELAKGNLIRDNIVLLAEMYDVGNKEVKVLKARENQSKEIKNLPVSALYMGSQNNILYDETIKNIFRVEFSTKLARRSFFNFNPKPVKSNDYLEIPEEDRVAYMLEAERKIEDDAVDARNEVQEYVKDLATTAVNGVGRPLPIDDTTRNIFTLYKRYNEEFEKTIEPQYAISKLVRKHMQWKALKLAGAIAIFEGEHTISPSSYIAAISYVEMLNEDMMLFEEELVKEPYEIFSDFMHAEAVDNESFIGLHALRKMGYIPKSGTPITKMKELVYLATSYDEHGIYSVVDDGIKFEGIVRTDVTGVSFVHVHGTKDQRKKQCFAGYDFYETEFTELVDMLSEDLAYNPFKLKTAEEGAKYDKLKHPNPPEGGIRGKENVVGGCKFVVLDIDDSKITDEEAHLMLDDINHHIARTSDPDNPYKFRVLIELDSIVDLPDLQWKPFIESIASSLMMKADLLPKSQIYFSFAGRNILSVTDAEPLSAKEHIVAATTKEPREKVEAVSKAKAKEQLSDPLSTFDYVFECTTAGSRNMIRAAKHALDLGATTDEIVELMENINDYWDEPLEEERFQSTIISQIRRW